MLAADLRDHIAEVDRRVVGGAYAREAEEIRRAAELIPALRARLDLGEFRGSLNPGTGKPQLLLSFHSRSHGEVVLKVYGRPRPNEGAVQSFWYAAGVAVVEVLAAGDDPLSWLLMPKVRGRPPNPDEAVGLTSEVGALMARAHSRYRLDVGRRQDLHQGVAHHLMAVMAAVSRHGYRIPPGWQAAAASIYSSDAESTFLHGDLTVKNLLRDRDGSLLVLDTCGYTGPAEFDAARWSARSGGSARACRVLHSWLDREPGLDTGRAERLLGMELLMEAGARELAKEEHRANWSTRDEETMRCLEFAGDLLACVQR